MRILDRLFKPSSLEQDRQIARLGAKLKFVTKLSIERADIDAQYILDLEEVCRTYSTFGERYSKLMESKKNGKETEQKNSEE